MSACGPCVVESAIDGFEWQGSEVGWFYGFAHEMGFADPRALCVGKDDGYYVAVRLEY
jgi:hypothetical protein